MPGIFISYRRDDSQAWAGRLYGDLRRAFGPRWVFRDVDTLELGVDVAEAIERWLDRSDIVLVVIGPQWLAAVDRNGRRRLDDPNDLVRLEAAKALHRRIRVVPVLVGGASMPSADELPEDLQGLARRNAHELSDRRWNYDLEKLTTLIKELGRKSARLWEVLSWRWALLLAALAGLIIPSGINVYRELHVSLPTTTIASQAAHKFGDPPFRDCPDPHCPKMVVVPAGDFLMGSPLTEQGRFTDEGPQHRVTIAQPFAIGRFEVTFDEWDACAAAGGCGGYRPADEGWGRGRRPVINVSWDDAKAYVRWLSTTTGKTYRLPSEAEWEYAARAGTTTQFWTGATISTEQANYDGRGAYSAGKTGEYRKRTVPVGSLPANPWGLSEVLGNVWEWVEDCRHEGYSGAPTDGSPWIGQCLGSGRVVRGGSWSYVPEYACSAIRGRYVPEVRLSDLGFRVSRALTP